MNPMQPDNGPILQLQQRAAMGDPQAQQMLQQMQAQQGGGQPPPQGMPPGGPPMKPPPVPADVQAQRANALIEALRAGGQ